MKVKANNFKIGIIGCGWLGQHIAQQLSANNKIYTTTTNNQKNTELIAIGYNSTTILFEDTEVLENRYWQVLQSLDCIIITVPFSKRESINILKNRFNNICTFINNFNKQLFLMSSIGIYPDVDLEVSENNLSEEALNQSILYVEQLVKNKFPKLNILRLGGLMGGTRVFSNYNIPANEQVVNHVHYEDICLLVEKMISEKINSKTYNVVAPLHPTKKEVIEYQKSNIQTVHTIGYGRKISSDLLQKELSYTFKHIDPRTF